MKASIVIAAAGLVWLGAAGTASAQTTSVTEPAITVGSTEPTPESPAIAHKEAAAALAQAKQDCRKQHDHASQQNCLSDARDDYNQMMAKTPSKH
jgi:hypothetical protein